MCVCVCVCVCVYLYIHCTSRDLDFLSPLQARVHPLSGAKTPTPRLLVCYARSGARLLAFTRYCNAHYCMVYGVKTGGRKGVKYCAIVMQ